MKILWTFDPFEKNKKLRTFGKKLLSSLFNASDRIDAVYVAFLGEVNLTHAFNIPKKNRFTTYPKKLINTELKKLSLKNIGTVVLNEPTASLTSAVRALASHSIHSGYDLIVSSTHGKSGWSRFILGSFAETLVHASVTDLLLYNQKTKLNKTPKTILYAHDFSKKGSDGLSKVMDYAKKWNASITIIHITEPNYSSKFAQSDDTIQAYRSYVSDVATQIEKTVQRENLSCNVIVETNWKKSESELILDTCKKIKADIIAVTAKSGRLAPLLGGSVTRNIIRMARIPILILKV